MVYTDNGKLRVVYGDYVLGVHGKGSTIRSLMLRAVWSLL
mgnify:CR=1 FL=1